MRNLLLMAQHEYAQRVRKRSFLLTALGMPLLIVFIVGITIALELNNLSDLPLGYVDEAGVLTTAVSLPENKLSILEFAVETDARQALTDGEIQGFFVVSAAYPSGGSPLEFFYETEFPGNPIIDEFDAFMRANLSRNLSPTAQQALQNGLSITIRSADGSREFGRDTWINLITPFVAAFFFFFAVMGTTGYLLEGSPAKKKTVPSKSW
ncbi:MAG: ABC transporter permease [Chloroflexi bacterium]|nr:ABC transporter permease [Chloroflexota bacterium]